MNEISHSVPLISNSMKTPIRYGFMNGGVAIAWTMFMYVSGLNRSGVGQTVNYIGMVIPLVFIYYAIKDFRLHQGHGFINFNQAFKQGFQVALIGGVIGTLFMILYMNVIDPT